MTKWLLASLFATAALAGCVLAPEPPTFEYTAHDFGFAGPEAIPSGPVRLTLTNEGADFHHLVLLRLPDDHDYEEFSTALLADGHAPDWAVAVGGPNAAAPGQTTSAILDLEPGSYAILCEIPDSQGTAHFHHGMVSPLTVKQAGTGARLPEADATITLADFDFLPVGDLGTAQIVEVHNAGAQPHEVTLFSLTGNATAMDLLAWLGDPANATGPPPGAPVGGASPMSAGQSMWYEAPTTPGRYAIICFLPDIAGGGAPHFALGMVTEYEVPA